MKLYRCRELDALSPLEVLARWPDASPVAMLHSAQMGRWSVLAEPGGHLCLDEAGARWTGPARAPFDVGSLRHATDVLDAIDGTRLEVSGSPFSGWMLALHYELGRVFEPSLGTPRGTLIDALWCPDALIFDSHANQWWRIGTVPALDSRPRTRPGLRGVGPLGSDPVADDWPDRVARAIEYIHAGDIFQVNLTRRISLDVAGDVRTWAMEALGEPQCTFGALLEIPGGPSVVSMSPEQFLDITPDGSVRSCPIKGTLPSTMEATRLRDSAKDAAELHMIVDLVRNDLGRMCAIGSVHVHDARRIESYPTVHHGVAEVRGRLRPGVGLTDVLRATFPAGSITGAPKIRAMQIAESLEPSLRGIYCGAIGMLGPDRAMCLSVAIRTATIDAARSVLSYGTGCGIVADSDPLSELAESQAKAQVLVQSLAQDLPSIRRPTGGVEDRRSRDESVPTPSGDGRG